MSGKLICLELPVDEPAVLEEAAAMLERLARRNYQGDIGAAYLPAHIPQEHTAPAPQAAPAPVVLAPEAQPAVPPAPGAVDTATVFAGTGAAVPPAAVPPAPAAAIPPAQVPPALELDKMGLPWDARIHTSNKAQNGSGNWKMKKGLPEGYFDQIKAEILAGLAVGTVAIPPAAATPPAVDTTPPAAAVPPAPAAVPPAPATVPPAAAVPPAPAAAVPPAAPDADTPPADYGQLLGRLTPHMIPGASQPITADEVNTVCVSVGVTDLSTLATVATQRPDLIVSVYNGCKALWSTRQ